MVPRAPYRILFCGSDAFASKSLEVLIQHRARLCPQLHVLTPRDVVSKWGGKRMRVSPVKTLAQTHQLPHQQVPREGMDHYTLPDAFKEVSPSSILLTCSFGHMIPESLLNAFPEQYQRLNIHPSLLPQLRGAAPIQWAISRQATTSGVSIQSLEANSFDSGRIFAQQAFPFPPTDTVDYPSIEQYIAKERASPLLLQLLEDLPGHVERSWAQDAAHVTKAPKVKLSHSRIDFSSMSSTQILANHRAFSYLYPLHCVLKAATQTKSKFPNLSVSFHDLTLIDTNILASACPDTCAKLENAHPGSAAFSPSLNTLLVKCIDQDCLLRVNTLQASNKLRRSAYDWWRSYKDRASSDTILTFQ